MAAFAPPEYRIDHVADTVVRIVLGYRLPDLAELNWAAQNRGAACASSF